MRKSIIQMAQAVAREENNERSNNKPSAELPRKKLALPGYALGDSPSHIRHMIIPSTLKQGVEYASTLQTLDFAFVLRSNGTWTYAIVCDILMCNNNPSIKFVVDQRGCTKTLRKKYWGKYIRLINEDHATQANSTIAMMA
jgi:hypothetical protein